MIRRREREEVVHPGLMQSFAHCVAAMQEIEVAPAVLQRPGEPKDGADGAEADEVQRFEVHRHGFGLGLKSLFDSRGEIVAVGCLHPRLGPSNQALSLFQEPDLHALNCR
jgi:hypothetical protein